MVMLPAYFQWIELELRTSIKNQKTETYISIGVKIKTALIVKHINPGK